MGLASEGNLEQQYRLLPFTAREVGAILRQMLNALVYLHVDFGITHRDVKPANILCDSRSHFRLADFGLAKEGDLLQSMKGTQPYMAPEMFTRKPYTAAVDLWGLGMVIAGLLTGNGPPGYKGNEGTRWCKAVVANFRRYEDCFQAIGSNSHEHFCLNSLVGQHMLKMEPEARESAPGCLDRGKFLWWMLDHHSDIGAETLTQEDPTRSLPRTPHTNDANGPPQENDSTEKKGGASGDNGLVRGMGPSGDNDSEAETEVSTNRTPISDDWASLERRFPNHDANGEGNEGKFNGPHNFARTSSADPIGHVPENPTTPSFNGHSKANAPQHNATANVRKGGSQGSRPASSAAPMGVQKPLHKHNKSTLSKSVAAAVAQQVAEEQPQNGEEISLDDYYKPGRPGHLLNPENRALVGAGETLEG